MRFVSNSLRELRADPDSFRRPTFPSWDLPVVCKIDSWAEAAWSEESTQSGESFGLRRFASRRRWFVPKFARKIPTILVQTSSNPILFSVYYQEVFIFIYFFYIRQIFKFLKKNRFRSVHSLTHLQFMVRLFAKLKFWGKWKEADCWQQDCNGMEGERGNLRSKSFISLK